MEPPASLKEDLVAAMVPVGSTSCCFGTTAHMGAQQHRDGLPVYSGIRETGQDAYV